MCCSLNIYMKYIYAEYFMVYLLRVRLKRLESPHHFLQHGGGGARRKRPFLAPPPSCWRLILLDTQAQQYGGGCEVEERGEADLTCRRAQCVRRRLIFAGRLSLLLSLIILFSLHSSFKTWEGQTPTPTCCSSSLTKGTISEPHWLECRIADFSSQAANWYVSHVNSPSQ